MPEPRHRSTAPIRRAALLGSIGLHGVLAFVASAWIDASSPRATPPPSPPGGSAWVELLGAGTGPSVRAEEVAGEGAVAGRGRSGPDERPTMVVSSSSAKPAHGDSGARHPARQGPSDVALPSPTTRAIVLRAADPIESRRARSHDDGRESTTEPATALAAERSEAASRSRAGDLASASALPGRRGTGDPAGAAGRAGAPAWPGPGDVDRPARPRWPIRPDYPPRARRLGDEATVLVEAWVDGGGAVAFSSVLESGGPDFDDSARTAVERSAFRPARLDGREVASRVSLRIHFRLQ